MKQVETASSLPTNKVGVFFCGPPIVGQQLKEQSATTSRASTNVHFDFWKENF